MTTYHIRYNCPWCEDETAVEEVYSGYIETELGAFIQETDCSRYTEPAQSADAVMTNHQDFMGYRCMECHAELPCETEDELFEWLSERDMLWVDPAMS